MVQVFQKWGNFLADGILKNMELSNLAKDLLGEYEALIFETLNNLEDGDSINGRQISQNTSIPKTTTHRVLTKLTTIGIVKAKEHSSMTLFSLNRDHILYEPISELYTLRDKFLQELSTKYQEALPADLTLVLYGSQARLEAKATSDVNILAVIEDDSNLNYDILDTITKGLQKRIGNIINLRIITDDDLHKMKSTKDKFLKNVLNDRTDLYGVAIEERYKR